MSVDWGDANNRIVAITPTHAQRAKLEAIADSWRGVKVLGSAYGCPPGYLSIVLDPAGHPIQGGISPEGDIST